MSVLIEPVLRALVMILAIIAFTRMQGLRSFSKISSFDFAITVAFGSILAGTLLAPDTPLAVGLVALAAVFLLQAAIGAARIWSDRVPPIVDNKPLLLMEGSRMLDDNMARARITKGDLIGKLREANVLYLDQVHAVVMEATGDVSVLHSGDPEKVDLDTLLQGVER